MSDQPSDGAAARTGAGRTELTVRGMNCSSCAQRVAEALQRVPAVASATVELEQGRASVRWRTDAQVDVPALLQAASAAGYDAEPLPVSTEPHEHDHAGNRQAGWQLTLWVGVLGTIPLMLGEWVFGLASESWFRWSAFGLATLVQVFAGARFYQGAWRQLKIGSSNMDTLVALGSTTAYAYSVWALFSGVAGHLYFMEAAAIITVISIGHWFEARATRQASSALRALLHLAPGRARRRNPNGSESEVPIQELQRNDLVVLRPGDRVPTDGEVVEGNSAVDESMLTGESTPIDKTIRDSVYGGTVNLNGRLMMRVTATGEETALAQVIAAVQRAQNSRANIQRLGDRVSSVFVPAVILVAVAAGLWWGLASESAYRVHQWLSAYLWAAHPPGSALAAALIAAAAVLIVACPCAMGLATPAAIMAGSNAAAQRGILIRDGVALEKAGQITAVLLDKTGTLTVGKPEVVRVESYTSTEAGFFSSQNPSVAGSASQVHLLSQAERRESDRSATVVSLNGISDGVKIAAALARHSNHPLSQAIAKIADGTAEIFDWQEIRGAGLEGKVKAADGRWQKARLGATWWLSQNGVALNPGVVFEKEWTAQGATVLGVSVGEGLIASIALMDTIKSAANSVVKTLNQQGLKVLLVTGDNELTARAIARQAGIDPDKVFAQRRPEEKAALVNSMQERGERVAFVGDGINDAPALRQANLGIAVARASDIARESADIILLKSEIEAVPESIGLAQATLRTIKQNLFWAFFYNAAGVPLAALGFLSPVLCAAAMGLSDLVVIGNALRLRRWKR